MTFITAELGANWKGNYDILDEMVKKCSDNNIDAVKLQCLSDDLIRRHPELEYYERCSVTKNNVKRIDKICRNYGMEWYSTITEPNQADYMKDYVRKAKIRAADSGKMDLINYVLDKFENTIISRSSPPNEYYSKIINLYCISKYPTEFGEINFDMITRPLFEGYSNHCLDPLALLRAKRLGAKYIEFHLTPSSDDFAIDNKVSFTYNQMSEFMKWLK